MESSPHIYKEMKDEYLVEIANKITRRSIESVPLLKGIKGNIWRIIYTTGQE